MDASKEVAGNIRALMGRHGITRRELAQELHTNEMWVGRRLNEQTPITVDDLRRFASALGCTVGDLLPEAAA